MDKLTVDKIAVAHPKYRAKLLQDYTDANNRLGKGCRLRFAYVVRTDAEQDGLYALGRTKVNPDGKTTKKPLGNIVTNAKGGQSIHNYALAFDIVLLYDKNGDGVFESVSWDMLKDGDNDKVADWKEISDFFVSKGYEWGGNWTSFRDYPHFQFKKENGTSYKWQELKLLKDNKSTIIDNGITYVKL